MCVCVCVCVCVLCVCMCLETVIPRLSTFRRRSTGVLEGVACMNWVTVGITLEITGCCSSTEVAHHLPSRPGGVKCTPSPLSNGQSSYVAPGNGLNQFASSNGQYQFASSNGQQQQYMVCVGSC